jgi:hypothetical protein
LCPHVGNNMGTPSDARLARRLKPQASNVDLEEEMTRAEAIEAMLQAATAGQTAVLQTWRRQHEFRWEVSGLPGSDRTIYIRDSDIPADKLAQLRRLLGEAG